MLVDGLLSFDEIVRRDFANPLVVMPPAAALGQTLGLARGETAVFGFIWVFSAVTSFGFMLIIGKLLDMVAPQLATVDLDQALEEDWDEDAEPYGEWDGGETR